MRFYLVIITQVSHFNICILDFKKGTVSWSSHFLHDNSLFAQVHSEYLGRKVEAGRCYKWKHMDDDSNQPLVVRVIILINLVNHAELYIFGNQVDKREDYDDELSFGQQKTVFDKYFRSHKGEDGGEYDAKT